MLSPNSQLVIGTLLAGKRLGTGANSISALDPRSRALLKVIVTNLSKLQSLKGDNRAIELRRLYREERKEDNQFAETAACGSSTASTPKRSWRLGKMKSQSVRGLAPYGEEFEFDFACKSNLIYGPNGSGKSSLFSAVSWVLTGQPVTDADESEDTVQVSTTPTAKNSAKALVNWPVMAALPDTREAIAKEPHYWSQIELHEVDGPGILHLRRDSKKVLHESTDGVAWVDCAGLTRHSISPLDLQLSLISSTAFGRHTLESCDDTHSVLSLMLGYDDIEEIGDLVSNTSGNCTRLSGSEEEAIERGKTDVREKLNGLPKLIAEKHPLHSELSRLAAQSDPTTEQIKAAARAAEESVTLARRDLAELFGIAVSEKGPPVDLADKFFTAVSALEKGVWSCFQSLASIRLESVFTPGEMSSPEEQLAELVANLNEFVAIAKERVAKRYRWWEKETAPGSKAALFMKAAQFYDKLKEECPVCEQSVANRQVKLELEQLKNADADLVRESEILFSTLLRQLRSFVPVDVLALGDALPVDRLLQDWRRLRDREIGTDFANVTGTYDERMSSLIESLSPIVSDSSALVPQGAHETFGQLGLELSVEVERAYRAVGVLRWGVEHLLSIERQLTSIIVDTQDESQSLLAKLSSGKEAAANVKPLQQLVDDLDTAAKKRGEVDRMQADLATLAELRTGLDALKDLRKFAQTEVDRVFVGIERETIENCEKLYAGTATGLGPSRLARGKGRGRSVESLLARAGSYEVPSQHFANAGLRRAIALAFYFALLQKHPRGLAFVLMDDPVLSLDEDHREKWSHDLLKPWMDKLQFVVATHQQQYLNNCRQDFESGQTFELIARQRPSKVAWRPGPRLDRAEEELNRAPSNAPVEMRKYREDLFAGLERYNATDTVLDIHSYAALQPPNPLVSANRDKIVDALRSPEITQVLDPGAHARTEGNVTDFMKRKCLQRMRELDNTVTSEFERLDELARRSKSTLRIIAPVNILSRATSQQEPWIPPRFLVIGRAAAKSDGCYIDDGSVATPLRIAIKSALLVAGASLDPVAQVGQWVLMGDGSVVPNDGDLVAVRDADENRFLRRAWSDGSRWVLHAVNPVLDIPAVIVPKNAPIQKIIGVLHGSHCRQPAAKQPGVHEWQPRNDFDLAWLNDALLVEVEGDSLNPIARKGQYVIVGPKVMEQNMSMPDGTLAVLDTNDQGTGQVIKCMFASESSWILTSRNPVEVIPPIIVPMENIRAVWPVRGVLFEDAILESD